MLDVSRESDAPRLVSFCVLRTRSLVRENISDMSVTEGQTTQCVLLVGVNNSCSERRNRLSVTALKQACEG